jgi:hypothetical protein
MASQQTQKEYLYVGRPVQMYKRGRRHVTNSSSIADVASRWHGLGTLRQCEVVSRFDGVEAVHATIMLLSSATPPRKARRCLDGICRSYSPSRVPLIYCITAESNNRKTQWEERRRKKTRHSDMASRTQPSRGASAGSSCGKDGVCIHFPHCPVFVVSSLASPVTPGGKGYR